MLQWCPCGVESRVYPTRKSSNSLMLKSIYLSVWRISTKVSRDATSLYQLLNWWNMKPGWMNSDRYSFLTLPICLQWTAGPKGSSFLTALNFRPFHGPKLCSVMPVSSLYFLSFPIQWVTSQASENLFLYTVYTCVVRWILIVKAVLWTSS